MKQRTVHFGGVFERILPDSQLTEAEREVLWFSKAQLRALRLLAESDNKDLIDSSPATIRPAASRKRSRYISYVLHLQRVNRESGIEDPVGLRALAVAQSKGAVESARFQAERDAAEVAAEAYDNDVKDDGPICYIHAALLLLEEPEDQSCSCSRNHGRGACPCIQTPRRNRTAANMA